MRILKISGLMLLLFFLMHGKGYNQTIKPTQVSGLTLWLRADSALVLNGANVVQWSDCSGNNNNAMQVDNSMQPAFIDSVSSINNKPAIRFDGINDFLAFNEISTIRTCFFVCKHATGYGDYNTTLGHSSLYHFVGGTGNHLFSSDYASQDILQGSIFENSIGSSPSTITKPTKYSIVSLITTGNVAASNIGSDRGISNHFWNGDFVEIIIYSGALNNSDRITVEKYLDRKYAGPPVNLGPDINIPYGFCNTTLDAGSRFTHFLWSTGDTTQIISVGASGTYSVTATDYFGYLTSDTINVIFPHIALYDTVFCTGSNVVLSTGLAGNYGYLWSNGLTTPTISVNSPGAFSVTVTDSLSCYKESDTVYVGEDDFYSTVSLGSDTTLCAGELIGLVSSGPLPSGMTYHWSTSDTTAEIPISTSGDYSVTVTNVNGCIAIDTVFVTIAGIVPNVDFSFNTACSGLASQFNNTSTPGGTTWLWNFGDGQTSALENPSHVYATGGDYNVSLLCSDGNCSNVISKTIHMPYSPSVAFAVSQTCINIPYSFIDQSFVSEGSIVIWDWNFGDGSPHSAVQNPQHIYALPGNYDVSLTVQTDSGCTDIATHQITVVGSAPAPSVFTLLHPVDNFVTTGHIINFAWNITPGAVTYTLEYSVDSLFTNNVIAIPGLQGPTCQQNIGLPQTYYWRVIAYNLCGDSIISPVFSFTFLSLNSIPGLQIWLRADSNVVLNGNKVSHWNDCSGNGNHALQPVAGSQPLIIDSVLNGLPVVNFNGSGYLSSVFTS
ncbi:MAG TPA: PKD domain-containing protein, partial [Paludibacteraceae bacterium]|nr:PKD domain-containing protein [Paludibacteraceae bacterium]